MPDLPPDKSHLPQLIRVTFCHLQSKSPTGYRFVHRLSGVVNAGVSPDATERGENVSWGRWGQEGWRSGELSRCPCAAAPCDNHTVLLSDLPGGRTESQPQQTQPHKSCSRPFLPPLNGGPGKKGVGSWRQCSQVKEGVFGSLPSLQTQTSFHWTCLRTIAASGSSPFHPSPHSNLLKNSHLHVYHSSFPTRPYWPTFRFVPSRDYACNALG